jgi:hypothetical protein
LFPIFPSSQLPSLASNLKPPTAEGSPSNGRRPTLIHNILDNNSELTVKRLAAVERWCKDLFESKIEMFESKYGTNREKRWNYF